MGAVLLKGVGALYRGALSRLRPETRKLGKQVGWIAVPFGFTQTLRLLTSITLAALLAPEIFGVMLLINSLRTGVELLSDIGIGQSVVRSSSGENERFLNHAWTLQVLRGALLTVAVVFLAHPVAEIYGRPEFSTFVVAISPVFLLTGLQSPALFLAQRRMQVRRRAVFDVGATISSSAIAVGLSLIFPTVWALIAALVIGSALQTALTYVVFDRRMPHFVWDSHHAREIIGFGKWIFLSTAIFFAATSFDRFYFVGVLPIAMAGVYGISRTFSEMIGGLAQRVGTFLVFPRVAAIGGRTAEQSARIRNLRRNSLMLVALLTGLGIAGSDQFILFAYDQRYHAAAFMVPILLLGVWFGVLASFADAMLMGCGRPAPSAFANGAKLLAMLVGLPVAMAHGTMVGALAVLVFSEFLRWCVLCAPSKGEGFASPVDDVQLTGVVVATAFLAKLFLGEIGAAPTIAEWWALRV